jgi:hypothetical protein
LERGFGRLHSPKAPYLDRPLAPATSYWGDGEAQKRDAQLASFLASDRRERSSTHEQGARWASSTRRRWRRSGTNYRAGSDGRTGRWFRGPGSTHRWVLGSLLACQSFAATIGDRWGVDLGVSTVRCLAGDGRKDAQPGMRDAGPRPRDGGDADSYCDLLRKEVARALRRDGRDYPRDANRSFGRRRRHGGAGTQLTIGWAR